MSATVAKLIDLGWLHRANPSRAHLHWSPRQTKPGRTQIDGTITAHQVSGARGEPQSVRALDSASPHLWSCCRIRTHDGYRDHSRCARRSKPFAKVPTPAIGTASSVGG